MTEILVPHPDPIQAGVWKYLESIGQPAVYGCARQVDGGALLNGGFNDQAGAAAECNAIACEPTAITVPAASVNDPVQIKYRVDFGEELGEIETYEPSNTLPATARDLIADLFINSIGGLVDLVVMSGGGIAAFQYMDSTGVIEGGDGSAEMSGLVPITINLLTFDDAGSGSGSGYDFVLDVFSESVSVHSCGLQDWPGV